MAALAAATGRSEVDVHTALAGSPDIEYDDAGRIVGAGISLRPTPHRFIVDGVELYTWCAMDTLVFPALLGRPARVESPCHTTGTPVRLVVEPDRIVSAEVAQPWLAEHPEAAVLPVAEAYRLGRACTQSHRC